jgi:nitrile hydratase accessory protein
MNSPTQLLSGQPQDDDGPVFREPWEAQAFAMTISLHERGQFTWSEWARALTHQIAVAQAKGDPDLGGTYYHHWLAALEGLVTAKQLSSDAELKRYQQAWAHAADRTLHGRPIELRKLDLGP